MIIVTVSHQGIKDVLKTSKAEFAPKHLGFTFQEELEKWGSDKSQTFVFNNKDTWGKACLKAFEKHGRSMAHPVSLRPDNYGKAVALPVLALGQIVNIKGE